MDEEALRNIPADAILVVDGIHYSSALNTNGSRELQWIQVQDGEQATVLTKLRMMGAMLLDTNRNHSYETAIQQVVRQGDVVLDAGTGTGLLAMMAARAKASKVYACEMNETFGTIATRIVSENQLDQVITIIPHRTDEVNESMIPQKVDVIVSETMDSILTTEGILETLRDAKERLGTPLVRIIPSSGAIMGRLVSLHGQLKHLHEVATREDIRDGYLMQAGSHRTSSNMTRISVEDAELFQFQFGNDYRNADLICQVEFDLNESVTADSSLGLVVWWRVNLSNTIHIETLWEEESSWQDHWHQALFFLKLSSQIKQVKEKSLTVRLSLDYATGQLRAEVQDDTEEHAGKRTKSVSVENEDQPLKKRWLHSHWRRELEKRLCELSSKGNGRLCLVDCPDWVKPLLTHRVEFKNKFTTTNSGFTPTVVVLSNGPQGLTEADLVMWFAYRCASMAKPPSATVPAQAIVKCAALRLKMLKDPRPTLASSINGFDHSAMLSNAAWTFSFCLFNYDYVVVSTETLTIASIDFCNGGVELSQANAKLTCNEDVNAVVFWVQWYFSGDGSLELASPFSPDPVETCQMQFFDAKAGSSIQVACALDSASNKLSFRCAND